MVLTNYDGLDDDDKVKTVSEINQNNYNNYDVINDTENNKEAEENFLMKMPMKPRTMTMLTKLSRK